MEFHDFLAGLAVLIGLIGIVVVFLPGLVLQVIAVVIWAFEESTPTAWVVMTLVILLAGIATVLKYMFPQKRLKEAGVPGWVLFLAVVVAIVGLFLIPVVGAPLGFVAAVYVFEWVRTDRDRAWPSTKVALKAVLASTGIELAGGFLITVVFFTAAIFLT